MLEVARRRLRGLLQFLAKGPKEVSTRRFRTNSASRPMVETTGRHTSEQLATLRAKAAAYLKQHRDHIALQRLRRNKALTPEDLRRLNRCW